MGLLGSGRDPAAPVLFLVVPPVAVAPVAGRGEPPPPVVPTRFWQTRCDDGVDGVPGLLCHGLTVALLWSLARVAVVGGYRCRGRWRVTSRRGLAWSCDGCVALAHSTRWCHMCRDGEQCLHLRCLSGCGGWYQLLCSYARRAWRVLPGRLSWHRWPHRL